MIGCVNGSEDANVTDPAVIVCQTFRCQVQADNILEVGATTTLIMEKYAPVEGTACEVEKKPFYEEINRSK